LFNKGDYGINAALHINGALLGMYLLTLTVFKSHIW